MASEGKECVGDGGCVSLGGVEASPESVGMDGDALDARLGSLLARWVGEGTLPMAVAMVARRGRIVWHKGAGTLDGTDKSVGDGGGAVGASARRPLATDSLYRIYSMTKPLTSVAIMMLVEEGLVHLNQPVHVFLGAAWRRKSMKVLVGGTADEPELAPCKKSIRVIDLLTHTAGLTYGFMGIGAVNPVSEMYRRTDLAVLSDVSGHKDVSLEELCATAATLPLVCQPGEHFHYSIATDVLGRVVEVASGMTLPHFFEKRILKPLGMYDTAFTVSKENRHRFARVWQDNPWTGARDDFTEIQTELRQYVEGQRMTSGGGGLVATLPDYIRFCTTMLNAGYCAQTGKRILSPASVAVMTSNHLPDGADQHSLALPNDYIAEKGSGFGLGFSVAMKPALTHSMNSVGTFEWSGAAHTKFWCDPVEDLTVVFATQVLAFNPVKTPVRTLLGNVVYGALRHSASPTPFLSRHLTSAERDDPEEAGPGEWLVSRL